MTLSWTKFDGKIMIYIEFAARRAGAAQRCRLLSCALQRRSLSCGALVAAEAAASLPGGAPLAFSWCGARHPPGAALVARRLRGDGAAERRSPRPSRGAVATRWTRSSRTARSSASGAFAATTVCLRVNRRGFSTTNANEYPSQSVNRDCYSFALVVNESLIESPQAIQLTKAIR